MFEREIFYVTNPTEFGQYVGGGTYVPRRAKEKEAWLTIDEAKALKDKGWIINRQATDVEKGVGPINGNISLPTIEYTGAWHNTTKLTSLPSTPLLIMPFDIIIDSDGPTLEDFYLDWDGSGSLTSLGSPDLTSTRGDFTLAGHPDLVSINFPAFVFSGERIQILNCASLETVSFPELFAAEDDLRFTDLNILESLEFPKLEYLLDAMEISNCDLITELEFPQLKIVLGQITIQNMPALTAVSLPVVEILGQVLIDTDVGALESVTIGDNLKSVTGNFTVNAALTVEAVDHILVKLASLDGTDGTQAYSNKVITLEGANAIPSAAGLTAKTTLEGRGNTVTVMIA